MQQWDVSITKLGRELHVGMTGGGRSFFLLQIHRWNCWMRPSERGLINTESTAASEWVILIQQHYHPAITLLIQPETSSAELMCLFPWIMWGHDLSLKSPECTGTNFCKAPSPQDKASPSIYAKCTIFTGIILMYHHYLNHESLSYRRIKESHHILNSVFWIILQVLLFNQFACFN